MPQITGSIWTVVATVFLILDLATGQSCGGGCVDKLSSGSALSCDLLKLQSGCDIPWMQQFCACTCDLCGGTSDSTSNKPQLGASTEEPPCECQNAPPAGSAYTCAEFSANGQCPILLKYQFCECECGKCKGAKSIVYIISAEHGEGAATEAQVVEKVEEPAVEVIQIAVNNVEEEEVVAVATAAGVQQEQVGVCPVGCTDITPDESYTCPEQKKLGKCVRGWMQGYCQCSCGTCRTSSSVVEIEEAAVISEAQPVTLAITPTVVSQPQPVSLTVVATSPQIQTKPVSLTTAAVTQQIPSTDKLPSTSSNLDFQVCTQSCNENPPPKSDLSCDKQKELGKCSRSWMSGFCECTCGSCDILQGNQEGIEQKSVSISRDTVDDIYVVPQVTPVDPPKSVAQQVRYFNNVDSTGNIKINILHFNDLHARLQPTTEWWWECEPWRNQKGECFGGVARIKTIVDQTRAEGSPMLLLDGGDDFVGTAWDYHDPTNKATAHFLNRLGVDAVALGNHEFDHGVDNLIAHIQQANYPFLSCNMDASKKPLMDYLTQKYTIKQIAGLKIGIFGLTTTYTNYADAANPYPVWFTDTYQAARECVQEMKKEGVNVVIALSHNGYNFDKHLAKNIRDIDIVVGAHSHTFLAEPGKQKGPVLNNGNQDQSLGDYPTIIYSEGKQIPVVQAGWASRYMGKLTVEFDKEGNVLSAQGQPILLGGSQSSNNVAEDQEFVRDLENWKWW